MATTTASMLVTGSREQASKEMCQRRRRERALRAASSLAGIDRALSESLEWEAIPSTAPKPSSFDGQAQDAGTRSYNADATAEAWKGDIARTTCDQLSLAPTLAVSYPSLAPTLQVIYGPATDAGNSQHDLGKVEANGVLKSGNVEATHNVEDYEQTHGSEDGASCATPCDGSELGQDSGDERLMVAERHNSNDCFKHHVSSERFLGQIAAEKNRANSATESLAASPTELASSESLLEPAASPTEFLSEALLESESKEPKPSTQPTELASPESFLDDVASPTASKAQEQKSSLLTPSRERHATQRGASIATQPSMHVDSGGNFQTVDAIDNQDRLEEDALLTAPDTQEVQDASPNAPDTQEVEDIFLTPPKGKPTTHRSFPTAKDQHAHVDSRGAHQLADAQKHFVQEKEQKDYRQAIVADSFAVVGHNSATVKRRFRLTGKRPAPFGTPELSCSIVGRLLPSARGLPNLNRTRTSEIRETIGHNLAPPEQGMKVRVLGDGWGGGSGAYLATVTEADSSTFTVIRSEFSADQARCWEETHVLREKCIPVMHGNFFETTSRAVGKRRRRI